MLLKNNTDPFKNVVSVNLLPPIKKLSTNSEFCVKEYVFQIFPI